MFLGLLDFLEFFVHEDHEDLHAVHETAYLPADFPAAFIALAAYFPADSGHFLRIMVAWH